MLKNVIELVVKSLVDKPESVIISQRDEVDTCAITIAVDSDDRGRIIGKDGLTIRALRTLASAAGSPGKEILVDIVDE